METIEKKLEDVIITSKNGEKFIFPAFAIDTKEKIREKVIEYAAIQKLAEAQGNVEMEKFSSEMLDLLMTQQFSKNPADCQDYYLKNGFNIFPTRSPETRENNKAR
jgi:hypothetical protein